VRVNENLLHRGGDPPWVVNNNRNIRSGWEKKSKRERTEGMEQLTKGFGWWGGGGDLFLDA